MNEYQTFIESKRDYGANSGFEPLWIPDFLFDFQKALTDWAIRKGRAAIFADCGMGKTPMQLVWAENVLRKTNKPVLIITPLSVSGQTLREADKFGIEAHRAMPDIHIHAIQVTNYEKLHYFNAADYGGVVCDESSILKNFDGTYKAAITEFMRRIPYRLLATATAAPNDWIELGTSSEALGYLGFMDMIKRFFTNKNKTSSNMRGKYDRDEFRLRGWAEHPFWRWVSSWARAARKPSDLGFDDDGFILPELIEQHTEIEAHAPRAGMLFDVEAVNWQEIREVNRRTIQERCETVAGKVAQHDISLAWCHLNPEGDLLEKLIPDSVQISGKDSDEKKEEAIDWFCNGSGRRVLISKPKIFGYGLNFQHCAHMTYFPSDSYEQYYQSVRRLWRYGQNRRVIVDWVDTKGNERVRNNLIRKSANADNMFANMVAHMNDAMYLKEEHPNGKGVKIPSWLQNK